MIFYFDFALLLSVYASVDEASFATRPPPLFDTFNEPAPEPDEGMEQPKKVVRRAAN